MEDLKKINNLSNKLSKENIKVEMLYNENGKTLEECIINILKSKSN